MRVFGIPLHFAFVSAFLFSSSCQVIGTRRVGEKRAVFTCSDYGPLQVPQTTGHKSVSFRASLQRLQLLLDYGPRISKRSHKIKSYFPYFFFDHFVQFNAAQAGNNGSRRGQSGNGAAGDLLRLHRIRLRNVVVLRPQDGGRIHELVLGFLVDVELQLVRASFGAQPELHSGGSDLIGREVVQQSTVNEPPLL